MIDEGQRKGPVDKLPPNAEAAERGVLGCCLHDPLVAIPASRKQLKDVEGREFFTLANRDLWLTLCRMSDDRMDGKPVCSAADKTGIDEITIQQRLKDTGKLAAGDTILPYLSELQDATPNAGHLAYYLEILTGQFAARQLLAACSATAARVQEFPGQVDHLLGELQRDFDRIAALRVTEGDVPQRLKAAGAWGEEVWNEFMGIHCNEEQGWALPIEFKFRVRLQECTLFTGDDGSGKSTFLNYAALHLAQAGARTLIASFEMPPKKTLRMLITQLVGTREFPDSNAGHALFRKALAWINSRFYIYDFLGIGDWRDVLTTFRYAAEHLGVNVFILDSVMRIGIADDDYGAQGLAAAQFAQFAQACNVHLFLVIHENKGSEGKAKVRGSKLWTANADNIVKIERNQDKGIKISELWAEVKAERDLALRQKREANAGFIEKTMKQIDELEQKWDARAVLLKQREMGSQQNSGKYFHFDWKCFQYREHRSDTAVNWMGRWGKREGSDG